MIPVPGTSQRYWFFLLLVLPAQAPANKHLEFGGSGFRGHNLRLFAANKSLWSETLVERWEMHLLAGSNAARGGIMIQGIHIGSTDIRGFFFAAEIGERESRVSPWFRFLAGPYRALRAEYEGATYGGSLGMEFGLSVRTWRQLHLDASFQWLAGIDHIQVEKPRVRAFACQTPLFGIGYFF